MPFSAIFSHFFFNPKLKFLLFYNPKYYKKRPYFTSVFDENISKNSPLRPLILMNFSRAISSNTAVNSLKIQAKNRLMEYQKASQPHCFLHQKSHEPHKIGVTRKVPYGHYFYPRDCSQAAIVVWSKMRTRSRAKNCTGQVWCREWLQKKNRTPTVSFSYWRRHPESDRG